MVQALNHAKHGVDILSGTRVRSFNLYSVNRHKFFHIANQQKLTVVCIDLLQVRTHFARPNWKEVFTKIASKHPYATVGKDTLLKHRIVNTEPYALMHAN